MFRTKKAQSTLEYIIIFSVVIVAVFAVAYKTLNQKVKGLVNASAQKIEDAGNQFKTNLDVTGGSSGGSPSGPTR